MRFFLVHIFKNIVFWIWLGSRFRPVRSKGAAKGVATGTISVVGSVVKKNKTNKWIKDVLREEKTCQWSDMNRSLKQAKICNRLDRRFVYFGTRQYDVAETVSTVPQPQLKRIISDY